MKLRYKFNEHECAFCKSDVRHGATVCASCGAIKGRKSEAQKEFSFMVIMGLFSVGLGIFSLNDGIKNTEEWLLALGFLVGGGILTYVTIWDGMKPIWLRRN